MTEKLNISYIWNYRTTWDTW